MARSQKASSKQAEYESKFDLGALFEFSTIINSSLDLTFILGHFLLTIMGKLLSLRGCILIHSEGNTYTIEQVKGLPASLKGHTLSLAKFPTKLLYVDRADIRKYPWLSLFRDHGIRLLVPLVSGDKILGVAGFAPSAIKKKLTATETTYVKSLANIAASAIAKGLVFTALERSNRELRGKIQELNTLFELSKEFNSILDSEKLVKLLMFSLMGQVGVNRYFVCLWSDGEVKLAASRLDMELGTTLSEWLPNVVKPTIIDTLNRKPDQEIKNLLVERGIQVLIPLQVQGVSKGVFGLGEKMRGSGYGPTDLEFLSSLGNLAIISLENAHLFKETIEKQRLEDELIIAKEIQRGLLPARLPTIPKFEIAATNISSKQVGGDYYDLIRLDENRFIIAIGDVSGKGTPASLLMANLQAAIRALVPLGFPLAELTQRVNDLICDNTGGGRFITFFWGILDAEKRRLTYVSAGHNPPFLFRANGPVERLDKGGLILGIMKTEKPYEEGEVSISNGDVLFLFTDGVSEAMNLKGDEWGEEHLEAAIRGCLTDSPKEIMNHVVGAVKEHSRHVPQSDDITMVVIKATG